MHFELAKDEEEAANQKVTLKFTVTRTPAQTYYYCVPRQGESYSTIALSTSTPPSKIELYSISFQWESNKQTILYAQAGTYDNPEAITNRECLKVTSEAVADAATPTFNVTLTPIGSSPMNMKDGDGNWIDLTKNLVASYREQDDQNDDTYRTNLFILRHSYHKVPLPAFVITPTPVSYTFGRNSETTNITFECTHQHGYEVYSPADKLVHTERTLHEQLTLGSAIDREHKTAKAEFSFQRQQELTAVDWVAQTESSTLANNTLSITAQENTTNKNRQALLVCKVSYQCDVNGMYEDNVTIQLRQRAKDGAITLQPNHGYANHVFGKNPYNNADEQLVHTAEQTIYYLPNDEIDLILPEAQFMGYKRWYDYETGCNPVWNLNESDRTTWHVAPAGTNINNSYGDSHGIYSTTNTNTNNPTADFITKSTSATSSNTLCKTNNSDCFDQIQFNSNNLNRSLTQNHTEESSSSAWYSYGTYYNWFSATAGNGTYSSTSSSTISGDIEPFLSGLGLEAPSDLGLPRNMNP